MTVARGNGVVGAVLRNVDFRAALAETEFLQGMPAVETEDGVVDDFATVMAEIDVEHGYIFLFAALAVVGLGESSRFVVGAGLNKHAFHGRHAVVGLHLRRECRAAFVHSVERLVERGRRAERIADEVPARKFKAIGLSEGHLAVAAVRRAREHQRDVSAVGIEVALTRFKVEMVAVASFVLPVLPFLAVVAAGLVEIVEVEGFVGHIGNSSRSNIGGQGRSNQIPAAFIVFIARNLLGEPSREIARLV